MQFKLPELLLGGTDDQEVLPLDSVRFMDPSQVPGKVEKKIDPAVYSINENFRGFALIFNHILFDPLINNNDVFDLTRILIDFGYTPKILYNLSVENMFDEIQRIKHHECERLISSDSIIIFILTNEMNDGKLLARDQEPYNLVDIMDKFRACEIPQLANKPKLVFVETRCPNGNLLSLLTGQQHQSYSYETDFFIELGRTIAKSRTSKSTFLTAFIETVQKCDLHKNDLTKIMNQTMQKINNKNPSSNSKREVPLVLTTLSKSFYFLNPKKSSNTKKNNSSASISVNHIKRMLYWFGPLISMMIVFRYFKKSRNIHLF